MCGFSLSYIANLGGEKCVYIGQHLNFFLLTLYIIHHDNYVTISYILYIITISIINVDLFNVYGRIFVSNYSAIFK